MKPLFLVWVCYHQFYGYLKPFRLTSSASKLSLTFKVGPHSTHSIAQSGCFECLIIFVASASLLLDRSKLSRRQARIIDTFVMKRLWKDFFPCCYLQQVKEVNDGTNNQQNWKTGTVIILFFLFDHPGCLTSGRKMKQTCCSWFFFLSLSWQ